MCREVQMNPLRRGGCRRHRPPERTSGAPCGPLPETTAPQTFLVEPSGALLVPWMAPSAGPLVRAVWEALSEDRFPVSNTTEKIYCG
jgi:hypothetical protein